MANVSIKWIVQHEEKTRVTEFRCSFQQQRIAYANGGPISHELMIFYLESSCSFSGSIGMCRKKIIWEGASMLQ